MTASSKIIFVGGHSKSGTTFIGRALGLFNEVCAKGEMDYFRQFFKKLNFAFDDYNTNIESVNREVYDGAGTLAPVSEPVMVGIHRLMFGQLFQLGTPVPSDTRFLVEKSPYNIFLIEAIEAIFPGATIVAVYRNPKDVYRSLIRHLSDHRDPDHADMRSKVRRETRISFVNRWARLVGLIEKHRDRLVLVQYQRAADDTQAFIEFARKEIFKEDLGLRAPVETLSKEYYLSTLPEEARAKSLVQLEGHKVKLSKVEERIIDRDCRAPKVAFDF